jgi:hypothetical protein
MNPVPNAGSGANGGAGVDDRGWMNCIFRHVSNRAATVRAARRARTNKWRSEVPAT